MFDGILRIQPNVLLFLSDRDGYGGGREPRGYMERPSTGSYRDPYDGYGKIKPLVCWKGLRGSTQTACFGPGKGCLVWLPKSGNIKRGIFSSWVPTKIAPTRILLQAVFCPPKVWVVPVALSEQPREMQHSNYNLSGIQSKPRKVHLLNNDVSKASEWSIVYTSVG